MDVIIIHDRLEVMEVISQVIKEVDVGSNIHCAQDIREARRLLASKTYDLMVLDLTIPQRVGLDNPNFNNVQVLLNEIYEHGDLFAPADLIGISREAESLDLMRSGLGEHFMVALSETDSGTWRQQLADRVKYAFRAADSKQNSLARHHGVDSLIITAMDEEFEPYRSIFDLQDDPMFPGVSRFSFTDRDGVARLGIGFSIGTSGQASAASRTQSLISWFRPKIAVMSGYCGGVKEKVELGDLCFFESAAPWDYGKWTETRDKAGILVSEEFRSRPNALGITDSELKLAARKICAEGGLLTAEETRILKSLAPNTQVSPLFYLTHAASGSAVVANDTIISQIRGLNDSIKAVDMESYGFYDACLKTFVAKPKFICVKSVSDFCNGDKDDGFHQFCSYLSAVTAQRLLTSFASY
jgi:nucleoside phosphorylase